MFKLLRRIFGIEEKELLEEINDLENAINNYKLLIKRIEDTCDGNNYGNPNYKIQKIKTLCKTEIKIF